MKDGKRWTGTCKEEVVLALFKGADVSEVCWKNGIRQSQAYAWRDSFFRRRPGESEVSAWSQGSEGAGDPSQIVSEGITRFEDGRVSVGITHGQTLFVAMELSSAVGPSIGVNIALDPRKSWTFDEIGGVTRWRRGSDFVGLTGDGGFMIRTVTGIMGDVSKFPPGRGVTDGEIGTEDLDFVVDVVLSRISESGVSDVISGVDKVARFLMDAVDGRGGGSDGIVNLFDILFVVDRL